MKKKRILSEKWDEDAANEEETDEGNPPIEQAKVYYFSGSNNETNHFRLLVMDEGVAMGDVVNFDENVPSIQFQHFGFQNNHQIIDLPVNAKIGIFSKATLQNIITLEAPLRCFINLGKDY